MEGCLPEKGRLCTLQSSSVCQLSLPTVSQHVHTRRCRRGAFSMLCQFSGLPEAMLRHGGEGPSCVDYTALALPCLSMLCTLLHSRHGSHPLYVRSSHCRLRGAGQNANQASHWGPGRLHRAGAPSHLPPLRCTGGGAT